MVPPAYSTLTHNFVDDQLMCIYEPNSHYIQVRGENYAIHWRVAISEAPHLPPIYRDATYEEGVMLDAYVRNYDEFNYLSFIGFSQLIMNK